MPSLVLTAFAFGLLATYFFTNLIHPLILSPLSKIPGPKPYALTKWRLAWEDWTGRRTRSIHALHQQYGAAIRIGPKEVHFNSLTALRTIYGAGSGFERTEFYRMFDAYGRKNMFTFQGVAEHARRKRLLAHAYSKSAVLKGWADVVIKSKIEDFIASVAVSESESKSKEGNGKGIGNGEAKTIEIFAQLHYYAIDVITTFLYGTQFGGTTALQGTTAHTALLNDIMDPSRRRLAWFAIHIPSLTSWLYTRTGVLERLVRPFLPMQKPSTYTGIRIHALTAMQAYRDADVKARSTAAGSIIEKLWSAKDAAGLDDIDVASECADHLLAGIDTTSDTLMFLIWCLSLPQNAAIQAILTAEARGLPASAFSPAGALEPGVADTLPVLGAVVTETLRLFAPLPSSEPRVSSVDVLVDGYSVPAGTVCSVAPWSLHRNADVFVEPLKWDPGRWMRGEGEDEQGFREREKEMKKWFWAFSSGARMCIGMHLGLAEMALIPSLYRRFSTRLAPGFEGVAPGITSRFEVFCDDQFKTMKEHVCLVEFVAHDS